MTANAEAATTIAFLDCSAGVAGDMLLGALIDAGASLEAIKHGLASLRGITGEWDLHVTRAWKGPGRIAGKKVHVTSVYGHQSLPAPGAETTTSNAHAHPHDHQHDHAHSHEHRQEHTETTEDGAHATSVGEEGILTTPHQGHAHDHTHSHQHDHGQHHHSHDHSHDHGQHHHSHDHRHCHGQHHHSDGAEPMRNLDDIRALVECSDLSEWAKAKSLETFTLLAEAEAHTHGTTIDEIHFHEVGAIDSIVDTVGSVLALDLLGVREVYASSVPFSTGTVKCAHGLLPVPPPATLRLMIGVPVCPAPRGARGELVTPTGLSLLKALASGFGEPPPFVPTHTGVGAGTKEFAHHANIVRVAIGKKLPVLPSPSGIATSLGAAVGAATTNTTATATPYDDVIVLETNIDDTNPQILGYVQERLLATGAALDVWTQPIQMKKNRPGVLLSVLCTPEAEERVSRFLFQETTTLGIRRRVMRRTILRREVLVIEADGRRVDVKVGYYDGKVVNVYPEYEQCKSIAKDTDTPLAGVIQRIQERAQRQLKLEAAPVTATAGAAAATIG